MNQNYTHIWIYLPIYLSCLNDTFLGKFLWLSTLLFISYLLTLSWFLKLLRLLIPTGIE